MNDPATATPRVARILPFLRWWPMVNRDTTRADVVAGITGAILGHIGEGNVLSPKAEVIGAIYPKLDSEICRRCTVRIFLQCHVNLPNGEPRAD